jgi:predicted amidophosphoribosyltransferase
MLAAGKYRRSRAVLVRLAIAAAARIESRLPAGVLVPVPILPARRRERGFNQSEIFAAELARAAGRDVAFDWLARRRGGRPLAGRPRSERAAAISGAFVATRRHPGDGAPAVILVDDVYTTGSTLGECERATIAAGGRIAGLAVLGRAFASRDDVLSTASAAQADSLARLA